jgi:glycosyltransferase involved in cell wall biosynthesis
MNILFLTDFVPTGGSTTFLFNAAQAFRTEGHDVSLVAFSWVRQPHIRHQIFSSITIVEIDDLSPHYFFSRIWKLYQPLKNILSKQHFDVIVLDLIFPSFALFLLRYFVPSFTRRLKNTRIVYQFHGLDALERGFGSTSRKRRLRQHIEVFLETLLLNHISHQIIVFSKYSKQLLIKHGVRSHIVQIAPGVEKELVSCVRGVSQTHARQVLDLYDKAKIVLISSRLEPRKGVLSFFRNLPTTVPISDIRFLLVSDFSTDGYVYELFDILAKKHLSTQVLCISKPSRLELAYLYRAANVVVVPSLDLETFGFVTLEAMSLGIPVVGFKIGANPELVKAPFLADPKQPNDLYTLIQKVLLLTTVEERILRKDLLTHAGTFSWKEYVRRLIQLTNLKS